MLRVVARLHTLMFTRQLISSSLVLAKASPDAKGGKLKMTFKVKKDPTKVKVKKGGMTHLEFGSAVTALGFEKLALDSNVQIPDLSFDKIALLKEQVTHFDGTTQSVLSELGSFRKYQHQEIFSQPISLVSANTINILHDIVKQVSESPSTDNRTCLLGERGSGKSTVLTQTMALALLHFKGDVVLLHFSNPEKITNGSSDYFLNARTGLYHQPMFTKRWIAKMRKANEKVFRKMPLTEDISFQANRTEQKLRRDKHTVFDFLELTRDFGKVASTSAFDFFVKQLQAHSAKYPVMVLVDDLNAVIDKPITKYYHPDFSPIHVAEFEMGKFLLNVAAGVTKFDKGAFVGAVSGSANPSPTSLSVALGLAQHDPYSRTIDMSLVTALTSNGGIKPITVQNLDKRESLLLLQFYRDTGVMHVKEYPQKKDLAQLKSTTASTPPPQNDQASNEEQFEHIANTHFVVSAGNPRYLLKAVAMPC